MTFSGLCRAINLKGDETVIATTTIIGAFAAPSVLDNKIENSENDSFSRVAKFIGHCADTDDVATCLAVKGITALNRAAKSSNIEILPGITFTREQSESVRSGKSLSENEIMTTLPKENEEKTGRLLDLALDSAIEFFKTHTLQIKVPQETTQDFARAIEEGRKGGGKMKKIMGPLMMAVGAKLIAMIPIFLGGLALLAIKAVVVAKIAFVMAILLGASKLFAGGAGGVLGKLGGGTGYNNAGWNSGWSGAQGTGGWTAAGTGGYPYARSYDTQEAQDIAYRGQQQIQQQ
ncbi:uncharacterized protein LOC129613136 [Condylostylus longicornis]|uniref:uncharacterized protein LOC129613136 n=1 Tax=Condylostylus longicornis TaxID=2530218 RepID=UPI00244E2F21|nr:uncharacterized protein LOC129613136 [Condylostylus longicornis]